VVFDTLKEAQDFANQIHVYDNKVLDCKVSLQHQDYITTSLNNIREPKKIFVDKIPKKVNKKDLENTFGVYGEIEEIIVIEKEKRSINFAYITYFDTESAQKCVTAPETKVCAGTRLSVVFARPKFSKKMLLEIPPLLKEYIRQIQKGLKEYDPKDFVNLRVEVVGETSTAGSESNMMAGMNPGQRSMSVIKFTPIDGMFLHPQYPFYQQQQPQPGQYYYPEYAQPGQMFTGSQAYVQPPYPVYGEPGYYTNYVAPAQQPIGQQMMTQIPVQMGQQMMTQIPVQMGQQMMTQIPVQMGQMRPAMPMPAPTLAQSQGQEYYVQYVDSNRQALDPIPGYSYQNQDSTPRPTPDAYPAPQTFENTDPYMSYLQSINKNARVQDGYQYTSEYPTSEYPTATNSQYSNSQYPTPTEYPTGVEYDNYYYGRPQNVAGYTQNLASQNQEISAYECIDAIEPHAYYERSYSGYSHEGYEGLGMGTGQDYSTSSFNGPCYKSSDHDGSQIEIQKKAYPNESGFAYMRSPAKARSETFVARKENSRVGTPFESGPVERGGRMNPLC
jgi:RNA recognition motif-containing protein